MKKPINGYVFAAAILSELSRPEFLFGPAPDGSELFEENGLVPFENALDAARACVELRKQREAEKRPLERPWLARIWMQVAETETEAEHLRGVGNLIVLKCDLLSGGVEMIGPATPGRPTRYPHPGALLSENGYRTYPASQFDHVVTHVVSEVGEEGLATALIATFSLVKLAPSRLPQLTNPTSTR